jgi:putative ABC transport system permease protein
MTRSDWLSILRSWRRQPGLALAIVATIAVGTGLNTTVFSFVHSILLRPLPGYETERLTVLFGRTNSQEQLFVGHAIRRSWAEQQQSFESLEALNFFPRTVTEPQPALRIRTAVVSPGYFRMYRARPALGRLLQEIDTEGVKASVAVLDYDFWQSRFGGDASVLGKPLRTNDGDFFIVGVAERSFEPVGAGTIQAYMPLVEQEFSGTSFNVLGRLKPGATLEQARAEFELISKRLPRDLREDSFEAQLVSLKENWVREPAALLWMLFAAGGLVLALACANLTNLLTARNTARRRDFAIRHALGATRAALLLRSIGDCLLLATAGGCGGMLLSWWALPALKAWRPEMLPAVLPVGVGAAVLGFSVLVVLLIAVLVGISSAYPILGLNTQRVLKEESNSSTEARSGHRLRLALTASQVAIAFALLVSAIAVTRSFSRLAAVKLGYRNENLLLFDLNLGSGGEATRERINSQVETVLERLRAMPGVRRAAAATAVPRDGIGITFALDFPDRPSLGSEKVAAATYIVSPDYFSVMGMRLLRGRGFNAADSLHARPVAIVSEELAATAFGEGNPVGHTIPLVLLDPMIRAGGESRAVEIVGVVNEIHTNPLRPDTESRQLYLPMAQNPLIFSLFVAETGAAQGVFEREARKQLAQALPLSPIDGVSTMRELDGQLTRAPLAASAMIGLLTVIAALLAALGIHGVFHFIATQRTREIGIRMVLGADAFSIWRSILGRVVQVAGLGLAAGVVLALALGRFVEAQLYGVRYWDAGSVAGAAVLALLTAVAGGLWPGFRAASIDPIRALRRD